MAMIKTEEVGGPPKAPRRAWMDVNAFSFVIKRLQPWTGTPEEVRPRLRAWFKDLYHHIQFDQRHQLLNIVLDEQSFDVWLGWLEGKFPVLVERRRWYWLTVWLGSTHIVRVRVADQSRVVEQITAALSDIFEISLAIVKDDLRNMAEERQYATDISRAKKHARERGIPPPYTNGGPR